MNRTFRIQNDRGWEARDPDVKKWFGLKPEDKWPDAGMQSIQVQGVTMRVRPRQPGKFTIRTICECPTCHRTMPVGRLNQHFRMVHE